MISRLAIFGATGDLTARYLLPGLAALHAAGHLGDGFRLVGAGRHEWGDDEFRRWASAQLDEHAPDVDAADRLGAGGGLLYRYRHDDSPDGIPGDEGAFLLCSFWLVDNLAQQGRLEEAAELYSSLCARASPTGLLSEQINPSTGEFMGNFPQAFSHIGVVFSGVTLAAAGWRP